MRIALTLPLLSSLWVVVNANVEKTIFLGPSPATVPSAGGRLDDLGLERLSPLNPTLRTQLNASFATDDSPQGTESWYFLENLTPGQRYEVRVCYLATQPTIFAITTHTLPSVIEDVALLPSISRYSASRLATLRTESIPRTASLGRDSASLDVAPKSDSVLFLRIYAAADYFTLNRTLMENVPPVAADIILDPFLANVFPRSLVPTAVWMVVVAGVGLVIVRWVVGEFKRLVGEEVGDTSVQEVKKRK